MYLAKFRVKSSNGSSSTLSPRGLRAIHYRNIVPLPSALVVLIVEPSIKRIKIVTIVIVDVTVELYQARPSQRGAIGKRVQHDMLSEHG